MTMGERLEKRLAEVKKVRENAVTTIAQCDAVIAELKALLVPEPEPELPDTE